MCRVCDGEGCMLCDYSYEDAEYNSLMEEIEEMQKEDIDE